MLVARGGRRIICSDKKDVVLGPYYTLTAKRGHGIMPRILNAALHDLPIVYENAYCYIKRIILPQSELPQSVDFKFMDKQK